MRLSPGSGWSVALINPLTTVVTVTRQPPANPVSRPASQVPCLGDALLPLVFVGLVWMTRRRLFSYS